MYFEALGQEIMTIRGKTDFYQVIITNSGEGYSFIRFASRLLLPKVISRMLRELLGISIAATNGDRLPCTAKNKPIML